MKLGKYKHYKGKFYEVLGLTLHTETREPMVLYKALYPVTDLPEEFGKIPLFVRPKTMFEEMVEVDGKEVRRFEYVE